MWWYYAYPVVASRRRELCVTPAPDICIFSVYSFIHLAAAQFTSLLDAVTVAVYVSISINRQILSTRVGNIKLPQL